MPETCRGFCLVNSPQELKESILQRIGFLLGITNIDERDFSKYWGAHMAIFRGEKPDISPSEYSTLINRLEGKPSSRRGLLERHQSLGQAYEELNCNVATILSYGLHAPAYLHALQQLANDSNDKGKHRALLVGALTDETAIEFTAINKHVFPDSETYIVDLEGEKTKEIPGFLYANGLRLPFTDGSFSSFQTNALLHMLQSDYSNTYAISLLLKEAHRVLRPGGKIIMCETHLDYIFGNSMAVGIRHLKRIISKHGFTKLEVFPASRFRNSQDMHQFFRSSHGVPNIGIMEDVKTFLFTATK